MLKIAIQQKYYLGKGRKELEKMKKYSIVYSIYIVYIVYIVYSICIGTPTDLVHSTFKYELPNSTV